MEQKDKYTEWDSYIGHLMFCQFAALLKYKNFIMTEVDAKNVYDLLFYRLIYYAEKIIGKEIYTYCYPTNYFKFLAFKLKERTARYPNFKLRRNMNTNDTHICDSKERAQLIEELAKLHNIDLADIEQMYKEYYMICK